MHLAIKRVSCAVLAIALLSLPLFGAEPGGVTDRAQKSDEELTNEKNFPFVIRVSTWPSREGFRKGDKLKIATVRGDRKRIEPGGTYLVQGTYTLASAPTATLALSLTVPAGTPGDAWSKSQFYKIEQGSGTFSFTAKMGSHGQYHVSFYIADKSGQRNSAAGGIYFE
jgi:hypothetical protein